MALMRVAAVMIQTRWRRFVKMVMGVGSLEATPVPNEVMTCLLDPQVAILDWNSNIWALARRLCTWWRLALLQKCCGPPHPPGHLWMFRSGPTG